MDGSLTSTHSVPVTVPVSSWLIWQPRVPPTQGVLPSQQGWPSSPQLWHIPLTQAIPELHVKPSQHTAPAIPQPEGPGASVPSTQTPSLQTRPIEQSLEPVHAVPPGARQTLPSQARPAQQSAALWQSALEPAWMQQMSPRPQ
jgi:hypothetical protein